MEPDDLGLGPYYHHHQQPPPPPPRPQQSQPPPSPTNGLLPNTTNDNRAPPMLYPHNSVPSAVSSPLATGVRRKRGRPRKYGTPEQAAAAKRLSSSSASPAVVALPHSSATRKKELSLGGGSAASFQKPSVGNAGQGFRIHFINVAAGEDIGHRIMLFMHESMQDMCVISARGTISNVSLRQPAALGGNISYEGRFNILKLCGSFVRTDSGGTTGGLSICLVSHDGLIIGGCIDGPLIAVEPVQVTVGMFVAESKKKKTAAAATVPPPAGQSLTFLLTADSSQRNVDVGGNNQQNVDGYQFMIPNRSLPMPSPWASNNDSRNAAAYDFSGRANHGARQSPEKNDYDRFQD